MPAYGGLSPGFERYGGGSPNALKAIVDSLGQQRGTAYDNVTTGNVYIENMALGRAIAECWSNNQRMANQWDAARMTEFIPRWEKILGLIPGQSDTDTARRARIAASVLRISQSGIYQTVFDQLTVLLGSTIFNGILTTSSGQAVVWTPSGWNVGSHDSTKVLNFYSTVAHILIQVTQPSGMTDGVFYQTLGAINPMLDQILPAWVTWDWARNTTANLHVIPIASSSDSTPIQITTGNLAPAGVESGFVSGQTVTIIGHTVNTNANGTWVISTIGGTTQGGTGTTFLLVGSTGTGAGVGGATGTVSAPGFYLDGDPSAGGPQANPNTSTLVNTDNEALTA